ncbi:hypothetical protein DUNSADRAFT_4451 [Dunaliella salina]|uniref:Uncharacterized protein n=1 Tax=Dunaliella salina TaxID=3046 RepID=A0ABQ7GS69_DUNSA|nr:hypothetical protein DUNSADRAFT_4451 [Dunaliella salina]|eukprot:KAF5837403.1 hypothetical protein DUNSADRAFT_4451 [Dunaliella salina]
MKAAEHGGNKAGESLVKRQQVKKQPTDSYCLPINANKLSDDVRTLGVCALSGVGAASTPPPVAHTCLHFSLAGPDAGNSSHIEGAGHIHTKDARREQKEAPFVRVLQEVQVEGPFMSCPRHGDFLKCPFPSDEPLRNAPQHGDLPPSPPSTPLCLEDGAMALLLRECTLHAVDPRIHPSNTFRCRSATASLTKLYKAFKLDGRAA